MSSTPRLGDVAALKRHFRRHGKPDAFVRSNDARAAEFKQTLEKAGQSVTKDILLTGFADIPIASLMTQPLTTVHQSREELGAAAFRRMVERISNPDMPPNEILLPAPLVARTSTERICKGRRRAKK